MEPFIIIPPQQAAASSVFFKIAQQVLPATLQANGLDGSETVTVNSVAGFAFNQLTLTGVVLDNQSVTINERVYTFKTFLGPPPTTANEVLIGAANTDSRDNLIAAINGATGAGITYGSDTDANPLISAVAAVSGVGVVVIAKALRNTGNEIPVSEILTAGAWVKTPNFAGGVQAVSQAGTAIELTVTNNVLAINSPIEIQVDKEATVNAVTVTLSYGNKV